jgi:hypothetical protein
MIQVYISNVAVLKLTTYNKDGIPVQPDSTPTVYVTDAKTGASVASGNPTLIDSDYPGEYSYSLSSNYTNFERVLKIVWAYYVNSLEVNHIEYLYVTVPYVTVDETILELGYSSRPEDPNYFPYDRIIAAERTARMLIDSYLGFSLSLTEGTITAYGDGADVLVLPSRIRTIEKIVENDEIVINYEGGEDYNIFGYEVEVTETGYGVRIVPPNPGDDIAEQEFIDITGYRHGRFRNGYRYEVSGLIGWDYIPIEIKQAAFLLINDLLCSESTWRNKYVKKINNGQMSIEFSGQTYHGTGNALADSILNKFRMIQAVII